ncbi:cytochrome c-type biogenesis protein [Sphingomonas astaxanthinifaciens]|uniref:cytochrome c-type biogenesis protein n=1 Tax=Sphingomonas astaxanthinifaciens TaxID=407019 RepID=UPI003CCB8034
MSADPHHRPSTSLRTNGNLLSFVLSGAKRSRRALALALVIGLAVPAHADSNRPPAPYAYKQLEDPRQEAEATALMGELRCLVCQGQSIHDSDAEMAGDMRHLVRTRIKAGESPEDIRAFLIDRYGSWVSYQPRLDRETWFLWAFPLLLLAVGGWLVLRRLKVRR